MNRIVCEYDIDSSCAAFSRSVRRICPSLKAGLAADRRLIRFMDTQHFSELFHGALRQALLPPHSASKR